MTLINALSSSLLGLHSRRTRPTLTQRLNVWRSRRALARLDSRALRDVGLTRDDVQREANKVIWDVPASWTCGK